MASSALEINAASASNVKFRGDSAEIFRPREEELPFRGAIAAECVSGLDVSGNFLGIAEPIPEPGIIIDPSTTSGGSCSAKKVSRFPAPGRASKSH